MQALAQDPPFSLDVSRGKCVWDPGSCPVPWAPPPEATEQLRGVTDRLYFTFCTCLRAKSLQSSQALYDPMDCSPPGPSVHGILQARIKVAISFSRRSSQARDQTCFS